MDEIEADIFDLNIEFDEIMTEWKAEDRRKPEWFLIALGSKDAPRASYDKCCQIYKSFKNFSFMHKDKEFFELVDLFTLAMVQNRLNLTAEGRG